MESVNQQLAKKLSEFDCLKNNPYREQAIAAMCRSVTEQKPLELLLFTCSTINAPKLFGETPWEYVSLDPAGNNLETDLPALRNILNILQGIYPVKLKIFIGNTDPYYIYLQQFINFPKEKRPEIRKKFEERWAAYRTALEKWLRERLPDNDLEVISWQTWERGQEKENQLSFEDEFNALYARGKEVFFENDLAWEYRKLVTQFNPEKYFAGLAKPPKNLLKDWICRKFTEYAIQGRWLRQAFPDAILIQNEKPSRLRSIMYQNLIKPSGKVLPVLYFFGADNEGYA